MYLGESDTDILSLEQAQRIPNARFFRDANGRLMMVIGNDVYAWNQDPNGLHGLDGFFSKITKVFKKITRPVRKVLSKAVRLHKKLARPVTKTFKKYAGVIAPVAAFIPVVGWAIAAAATVVALKEKKKKAKSAEEAARIENEIAEAQMRADEAKFRAEQEGYDKEYAAELAKMQQQGYENYLPQQGFQQGFAPAPFSGGGGSAGSGGGGGGGGFRTNEDAYSTQAPDSGETPESSFDAKSLIIPAAVVVGVLLLSRKR